MIYNTTISTVDCCIIWKKNSLHVHWSTLHDTIFHYCISSSHCSSKGLQYRYWCILQCIRQKNHILLGLVGFIQIHNVIWTVRWTFSIRLYIQPVTLFHVVTMTDCHNIIDTPLFFTVLSLRNDITRLNLAWPCCTVV